MARAGFVFRFLKPCTVAAFLGFLAACGGGGGGEPVRTVTTVTVSSPTSTPKQGDIVQLTAVARDQFGDVLPGKPATWSSSDAKVATISPSGLLEAVALGTVVATAAIDGLPGSLTLTIVPGAVASVTVGAPTLTAKEGETVQLTAVARDRFGNIVPGTTATWANLNPAVASVAQDGLLLALKTGTATVTATVTGVYGALCLTVTPADAGSAYIVTLAGVAGIAGSNDGACAQARFNKPAGIAVDLAGNVYVADGQDNTIRKITPAGVVTTLAGVPGGYGFADGTGASARFGFPVSVAADKAGNLFVADQGTHVIRKVTPTGVVTTIAGSPGQYGFVDGPGAQARFHQPDGVAVDDAGNVYVSDGFNDAIRKISPGGVVSTLAATPKSDIPFQWGPDTITRIAAPIGLDVDTAGDIYVANGGGGTVLKVSPSGTASLIAGYFSFSGSADGTGVDARFNTPFDVAVERSGGIYVTDTFNCTIRKIVAGGVVSTFAGVAGACGAADGPISDARFFLPWGIAVDVSGNIYVADSGNRTIRKLSPATGAR